MFRTFTIRERNLTLGAVLVVFLVGALDNTIVSTAMPRIITDLDGLSLYTWVTTAYLLASSSTANSLPVLPSAEAAAARTRSCSSYNRPLKKSSCPSIPTRPRACSAFVRADAPVGVVQGVRQPGCSVLVA